MARKKRPWDALYDRVHVVRDAVTPVTDAELDDTESALGVPLPASYRAFMRRFGPGHLSGWWLLPHVERPTTIVQATRSYREAAEKDPDDFPNGEWHAGVVRFGSYGPHDLAWNSLDAGETRTAERPVYDLCAEEEQAPRTWRPRSGGSSRWSSRSAGTTRTPFGHRNPACASGRRSRPVARGKGNTSVVAEQTSAASCLAE